MVFTRYENDSANFEKEVKESTFNFFYVKLYTVFWHIIGKVYLRE